MNSRWGSQLMPLVICGKCGSEKKAPQSKCRSCGFHPRAAEERAQALYLSHGMFTEDQRQETPELVPSEISQDQLEEIALEIKSGKSHQFDPARFNVLLAQHAAVAQVSLQHVAIYLLRFFAPAILLIGGLFVAVRLLRGLQ